jgi:hypothetical protein
MGASQTEVLRVTARQTIHDLYQLLAQRPDQTAALLDIRDVLLQVYRKLETSKRPEVWVNRLMNYIRNAAIKDRLYFPKEQEALMLDLGEIGQKAGFNSQYRADFSDKSQFYGLTETMPRRR